MKSMKNMIFGFGYVLQYLYKTRGSRLFKESLIISRHPNILQNDFPSLSFLNYQNITLQNLSTCTVLISSVPPSRNVDPVLTNLEKFPLNTFETLKQCIYLSATSVYGNAPTEWIDEKTETNPITPRGLQRKKAEDAWIDFCSKRGVPLTILRLSGIYGPKRNPIERLLNQEIKAIYTKQNHFMNRIHVEDITQVLEKVLEKTPPRYFVNIYNVSDDLPASYEDVLNYTCSLIGHPPLPRVSYENAPDTLRSFFQCSKRIHNAKMKKELNVRLIYPDYEKGLSALYQK